MEGIYKTADLIYLWLGPDSGDRGADPLRALETLGEIRNQTKATDCWSAYGWAWMSSWLSTGSLWLTPVENLEGEGVSRAIAFGLEIFRELVRT